MKTAQAATLDSVLITPELQRRPQRAGDPVAENHALISLVGKLGGKPSEALQALADAAIDLCGLQGRGTAGVSVVEADGNGGSHFRWTALSGTLAAAVGGTTPRDHSPCAVCLGTRKPDPS